MKALKWPAFRCRVVGIDPQKDTKEEWETMIAGEAKNGVAAWKTDMYGKGESLTRKRIDRGWTEEEGKGLEEVWRAASVEDVVLRMMNWKGGSVFDQVLPWEDD